MGRKFFIASALLALTSGCGSGIMQDATNASSSPSSVLPTSCYVSGIAKPASLCGLTGFTYLLQTYVNRQCGSCHFENSTIHWSPLGDPNPAIAYPAAKAWSPAIWLPKVTANPFLTNSQCNLRTTDQLYADLNAWLACQ